MKWNKIVVLVFAICLTQVISGQKVKKGSDKPITITGKVLNSNQDPVAGAVLYIDNIRTSNITSSDGSYKIKVSRSAVNLEARSSQFGFCVSPINGQTSIIFLLSKEGGKAIYSGDITKGTGKGEKKSKVRKMNTYNDIYQMIRGEVPGVMVSGRSIQIQQGHSFIGSGQPLYVINGVIVNSIDEVNPLDVKSIKALKGSEAAIYGVRGSNGVISITLKNGTEKDEH